jgi:hypothetical protein
MEEENRLALEIRQTLMKLNAQLTVARQKGIEVDIERVGGRQLDNARSDHYIVGRIVKITPL